ncbi:MAG: hypothetical protein NT042_06765 [Sulfuritalea sp.]|nr:hypothetical protein [Sulfuritalea sp.]
MIKAKHILGGAAALLLAGAALAAGADLGQAQKQATNWTAIVMFGIFVGITLWITKWAATKTKTSLFPRHFRPGVRFRLRWPDLLDRLAGRLAGNHLPDGGAPAQPRQVHLR